MSASPDPPRPAASLHEEGGIVYEPEPARWTELKRQRSYAWPPFADAPVVECDECGPFWFAQFEQAEDGRLVLREWHRDQCSVWKD